MSSDSEDQDQEKKAGYDTKLDLSYHELDDSSLSINLTEFSGDHYQESQSRLEKLLLYNNILEGIPTAVTDLTKLTLLDISNNLLRTIPQAITNLVNLTQLYLRNNEIGDEDLPKDLRSMLRLRDLNLSGNRLRTIPQSLFHLEGLRNLFLGGNQLMEIPSEIKAFKHLKVLYLGGNLLTELPSTICQLKKVRALILCQNRLRSLPNCICKLQSLECLQLHQNELTTLPHGLIFINSLKELSLRDNPLVIRFVQEMAFQPASLLELSARVISNYGLPFEHSGIPHHLVDYLHQARSCLNPRCRGVYFDARVEHVKFVDFCGMYRIPLLQYLCSSSCRIGAPAVQGGDESNRMRRVLLG